MSRLPFLLALVAVFALVGCGAGDGTSSDRWVALARGFSPSISAASIDLGAKDVRSAFRVTVSEDETAFWIETTIEKDAWKPVAGKSEWWAKSPFSDVIEQADAESLRLTTGEGELALSHHRLGHLAPGLFWITQGQIVACGETADWTPPAMDLRYRFDLGEEIESTWRVEFHRTVADAIPVWTGCKEEIRRDVPADSVLHFGTAYRPLPIGNAATDAPVRFIVTADGETVHESLTDAEESISATWYEVPLPFEAAGEHTLVLSVEGPAGIGVFVNPRIGPKERGTYTERPWGRSRPNLLVFMADTFRADNLETYGGPAGRTPNLDALAARSLCLRRAWATATWTLPSQASVMTGLYPSQHGADTTEHPIPRELITITERLAAKGYRTGAVTDSGLISRVYQFDQGFEWFHESRDWDLRETFARVSEFLARDDGRPVFLYVHSYRTHTPYRQGADEDVAAWNQLLLEVLKWTRSEVGGRARPVDNFEIVLEHFADEAANLYGDGVRDLDEQFGAWCAQVEEQGLLKNGYLVFTGDHGEAFGEHGQVCHGGQAWQEKIGIPLFILGDAIKPEMVSHPASLLDITSTLADLAGIPDDPAWQGQSLLDLSADRTVFSFTRLRGQMHVGILQGARKSMRVFDEDGELEEAECLGVYDLEHDPLELRDLALEDQNAGPDLWRRWLPEVEALLQPAATVERIDLDEATRAHLNDIGYGGD